MTSAAAPDRKPSRPWRFRLAALGVLLAFAAFLIPYGSRATGFTSLISIGEKSGPPVASMATAPHHQYKDSWGYDGMQYAQLALHPTLREPALRDTVDNLPYRARRILMPWAAYLAGLGEPAWILQAYALINVVCWFALAFLLWRWLPADNSGNWLRWAGVLFSHGACMSVQMALTDLPGLTLLVLAVFLLERQRHAGATCALAAAVLCKETSLIAGGLLWKRQEAGLGKGLLRFVPWFCAMLAPFAFWFVYLRLGLGLQETQAAQNFGWPLAGLVGRWGTLLPDLFSPGPFLALKIGALLSLVALCVQMGFLLLRWEPASLWWRLGAPFAVLGLFVAGPVWEGYPGAATRVLLPMSLAFNMLVPRTGRWLLLLILGNLSVFSAVLQLRTTPVEFTVIRHQGYGLAPVWVSATQGWHVDESNLRHRWRWTSGEGRLTLTNREGRPLKAFLKGRATAASERTLRISTPDGTVCEQLLPRNLRPAVFQSQVFDIPAAGLELHFSSDRPAAQIQPSDPRLLAFMIEDLELILLR